MPRTAAVIIIGNEILSGKVRDENSHFLASELRQLGVKLSLVMVIQDDVDEIASTVASCAKRYDYVFTSGGIGPTHDDVTMQGIARAFGRKLVVDEKLKDMIEKRCGVPSSVVMRMAELPEGGELIELNGINFPPMRLENVYVFPGIPEFLRKKFAALKERFRDKPYFTSRVYINGEECLIADTLDAVAKRFPAVEIGSYPKIGERDYKVLVTFESMEEEAVKQAVDELLKMLPREIVLRTL